ncbi:Cap-specific mRNA (nucleoside-2'-O-)-methyltransferase 1 [Thelohanellus kitauei]|uniref:Cap-specific mRNA (nucleoside-2'-O-)-methyltransferase 1 n=1 Tax=Thelohanellus kitauei TaxID=669202 RepID=A0A0C2JIV9_THEKT|nr:Cap-specific mRNA (nucleoside-2'-O-)-methyltransferase 1 [Thelohanellus kitauei]
MKTLLTYTARAYRSSYLSVFGKNVVNLMEGTLLRSENHYGNIFELPTSNNFNFLKYQPDLCVPFNNSCDLVELSDLRNVVNLKNALKDVHRDDLFSAHKRMDATGRAARRLFNTRYTIRLTRAAMKIAEVNQLVDSTLTSQNPNSLLEFADLCCGDGGFTEYVLFVRNGWTAKGYNITLKSPNNQASEIKSKLVNTESTVVHFGTGDGDLLNFENIKSFSEFVRMSTDDKGVDLVLADGAFECLGFEQHQETMTFPLFVTEVMTCLSILKLGNLYNLTGGNFCLKIFDVYTSNTAALLFILCSLFKKVYIVKPASSRASNSEKF